MANYVQQNRKVRVTTPVGEDVLFLKAFSGTEEISRPFRFSVEMIAENKKKVPFDAMLGEKVTAHLLLPDESTEHHFNGVCVRFAQAGRDEEFTIYRVELVPEFQLLAHNAQSRIFQRKNVPDILREVMKGVTADWQLEGKYEKRDFCVQYRETDFNFASRLMEEEGIFYFFKHEDGKHTMVVADSPAAFPDLPGESEITFEELAGGTRDDNRIWAWERAQEARSTKCLLWDHTFELPHKHLEAESPLLDSVQAGKDTHQLKIKGSDSWELYDWPGEYAQRFDGINRSGGEQQGELQKIFQDNSRTVGIRMDEQATLAVTARGKSNVKHFMSGHKLTLKRHFSSDGAYVLSSVTHRAAFGADYRSGKDPLLAYQNDFTCFPSALPYRPKRVTAKPVVQGSQSAVVVGPKGEEIFTDKYGRVKVQFHWDREGKNDEDSSCWLRVGQLAAGRRWGASYWPRIGQEVIVDFFEGDPDQPIIVGTVYNADQMPPYLGQGPDSKHKNDNKVSGFKSNTTKGGQGFNELRFDDTKDKQQVFVHAEKNMDTRVKNDSMENVGHDKHLTVGGTKDGKNVGDYRELVYRDVHLHNKKNLTQHVGGDIQLLVGGEDGAGNVDEILRGNRTVTVEGSVNEHVKGNDLRKVDGEIGLLLQGSRKGMILGSDEMQLNGPRKEKIGGGLSLDVGGNRAAKIGGNDALEVGKEIHLKAGMKVVVEAGVELTLKGPGGFVKIDPSGVTIVGNLVLINSGGAAGSGSGANPEGPKGPDGPQDAKEAKPEDPTAADDSKTGQKSC